MNTAPAVPADIAAMLATGSRVVDAAAVAGISPPPGMVPVPPVDPGSVALAPVADPAVAFDPAAAFKAAVAHGIEANAPAALAPVGDPAPVPALVVGAAVPLAAAAPTFAGTRARTRTISLEWPLLWQGQLFEAVVVTRPTTGQVATFYERLLAQPEGSASLRFPLFYDTAGVPIPDAVMSALDPDDDDRLMEAVSDFLPGRLRRLQAPPPVSSPLPGGDTTGPTS